MKSLILRNKMCIWLAALLLVGGVCLSMSQTVSFVVYSYDQSDISVSTGSISRRFLEPQASVLSSLTSYHAEQMLGKAFSGRIKNYGGIGEHGVFHTILDRFWHVRNGGRKAELESDVVYHLSSTLIIDYVHLMDGA